MSITLISNHYNLPLIVCTGYFPGGYFEGLPLVANPNSPRCLIDNRHFEPSICNTFTSTVEKNFTTIFLTENDNAMSITYTYSGISKTVYSCIDPDIDTYQFILE
jgi:hypothetical protein